MNVPIARTWPERYIPARTTAGGMAHYQHSKSWTERTGTEGYPEPLDYQPPYDLERHAKAQGFMERPYARRPL